MSALGAIASSAFDAATSLYGMNKNQSFNKGMAREQRRWAERMSNTQYQRAAKDLEKAGLNRVLALGSPASTPAGSSASSTSQLDKPDVMGKALMSQQLANAKETQRVLKKEVELKEQLGNKAFQEWQNAISAQAGILADSRNKGYEADKQRVLKVLYDKPGKKAVDQLDRLFDFIGIGSSSAKEKK